MNNDSGPLEALRRRLGITDDQPRVTAGAVGPGSFPDQQRAYQERMKALQEAGADYAGIEEVRRLFRRFGR